VAIVEAQWLRHETYAVKKFQWHSRGDGAAAAADLSGELSVEGVNSPGV
jgi:hypothetical protein